MWTTATNPLNNLQPASVPINGHRIRITCMSQPGSPPLKPTTYLDDKTDAELKPSSQSRLLFKAWLSRAPGSTEELGFFAGPSACGTHDVLWLEIDKAKERYPVAWLPRKALAGPQLWRTLLTAYWEAEKSINDWDEPNFSEILPEKRAALTPRDVNDLAIQIWPGV